MEEGCFPSLILDPETERAPYSVCCPAEVKPVVDPVVAVGEAVVSEVGLVIISRLAVGRLFLYWFSAKGIFYMFLDYCKLSFVYLHGF